jgi:hypothetical protein
VRSTLLGLNGHLTADNPRFTRIRL